MYRPRRNFDSSDVTKTVLDSILLSKKDGWISRKREKERDNVLGSRVIWIVHEAGSQSLGEEGKTLEREPVTLRSSNFSTRGTRTISAENKGKVV